MSEINKQFGDESEDKTEMGILEKEGCLHMDYDEFLAALDRGEDFVCKTVILKAPGANYYAVELAIEQRVSGIKAKVTRLGKGGTHEDDIYQVELEKRAGEDPPIITKEDIYLEVLQVNRKLSSR